MKPFFKNGSQEKKARTHVGDVIIGGWDAIAQFAKALLASDK